MQEYKLEEYPGLNLYIALYKIREEQDPSLQFDFVCRAGICGSCAMMINGPWVLPDLAEDELASIRNLDIGFVFQLHHLLPQLSVLENVLVPTLLEKVPSIRKRDESRARELLARVGLSGRITYRPGRLSGGERQRAAVVRALINGPRLLLADEPTGSLDRAASGG